MKTSYMLSIDKKLHNRKPNIVPIYQIEIKEAVYDA